MVLRNFDNTISSFILGDGDLWGTSPNVMVENANIYTQTTNGTLSYHAIASSGTSSKGAYFALPFFYNSICIGDGDNAVTYEDYRLYGSKIGGSFTNVSNTITFDETSQCWVKTLVVKYTNSSDADFEVKEWGIWRSTDWSNGAAYSNNSAYCMLMFREVLDEPVTIAANSTATLTFTLAIPHKINAF